MSVTIYHDPACEVSRKVLDMIRSRGIEPQVVEFRAAPPDRVTLLWLLIRMAAPARDLLRRSGVPYHALGLDDPTLPDAAVLDAMVTHPALVDGPIVSTPIGVRLCRPPERLEEILPP